MSGDRRFNASAALALLATSAVCAGAFLVSRPAGDILSTLLVPVAATLLAWAAPRADRLGLLALGFPLLAAAYFALHFRALVWIRNDLLDLAEPYGLSALHGVVIFFGFVPSVVLSCVLYLGRWAWFRWRSAQ